VTYSLSLNATASACRHHAWACLMAVNTFRSSDRGRNFKTLYEASCNPRLSEMSARYRVASFFEKWRSMKRTLALISAMRKISSADGSGKSGTGLDSGTPKLGRPEVNEVVNEHHLLALNSGLA
jgi:hypothetical protein